MRFFTDIESSQLNAARCAVDPETATIVYATWENPFARGGGIIAVASNYGAELVSQGREVVMLSPYHTFLSSAPELDVQVQPVAEGSVEFGSRSVPFTLYEYIDKNQTRWILVKAAPYFEGGAGQADPYQPYDQLLSESVFFCKAAPAALKALGLTKNLVLHLQDWQTASIALTAKEAILKGDLQSAASVLTMHNPYDRGMETDNLTYLSGHAPRTVYQWTLPLMDGPTSTVSVSFAQELTEDPLQSGCFAGHLQSWFKEHPIVGVDNGLFGQAVNPFSTGSLLAAKKERRNHMLKTLGAIEDPRIIGSLDFDELLKKPNVPVFMMFGRLDPGQKGFDVLAAAIEALAKQRIDARFILTPSAIDRNSPFADRPQNRGQLEAVAQLGLLAHKLPKRVVIYPYRLETGYMETMAGATFAIFPSLYEPFGGATEPYLNGTPVIARRTGGLQQQVAHGKTGLLYHEGRQVDSAQAEEEWRDLQGAPLSDRMRIGTYRDMVGALTRTLEQACNIYQKEPSRYAEMLGNLYPKACEFSWKKTANEYQAIYEQACS